MLGPLWLEGKVSKPQDGYFVSSCSLTLVIQLLSNIFLLQELLPPESKIVLLNRIAVSKILCFDPDPLEANSEILVHDSSLHLFTPPHSGASLR